MKNARPLRDEDIREALVRRLSESHRDRNHVLLPEVDIAWSIPGRIDELLVADRIYGFEIKSDVDSLRRLPSQVQIFGPVLERAAAVVGAAHLGAVEQIVPPWWAIWVARRTRCGEVRLTVYRRGRLNRSIDPYAVAELIPQYAAVQCLRDRGVTGVSRRPVGELRKILVESTSKAQLVKLAREAMLARADWRHRAAARSVDFSATLYRAEVEGEAPRVGVSPTPSDDQSQEFAISRGL